MNLFTLFISFRSGGYYSNVFTDIEDLRKDPVQNIEDVEGVDPADIPLVDDIQFRLENTTDGDCFWEFEDSTWCSIHRLPEARVEAIRQGLERLVRS